MAGHRAHVLVRLRDTHGSNLRVASDEPRDSEMVEPSNLLAGGAPQLRERRGSIILRTPWSTALVESGAVRTESMKL